MQLDFLSDLSLRFDHYQHARSDNEKRSVEEEIGNFVKNIKGKTHLGPITKKSSEILRQLCTIDPILSRKLLKRFPPSQEKQIELFKVAAELYNKERFDEAQKVWDEANKCTMCYQFPLKRALNMDPRHFKHASQ